MTTGGRTIAGFLGVFLLLAGAVPVAAGEAEAAPSPELVARVFERFRGLAGSWRGSSTKGWTGSSEFRPLARGTVVLSLSEFDDAPPERAMASAVHVDGGRLVLTHYCEAGNQPRLVAAAITPDAREVEFRFLDGTGMASRDEGHMDRAVFRFHGPDRFDSRWTWYQDGRETWLEEITYVREETAAAAPATAPAADRPAGDHH